MYESLERRATTLVLASGIVIPLSSTFGAFGFEETDVPAVLLLISLGLLTVAIVLAVVALAPNDQADGLAPKAQLVFWAHLAFAAGVVFVAANAAYLAYRMLTANSLQL